MPRFFTWLFFTPTAPEEARLPTWAKYALPLALFLVIRLITHEVLEYRGALYGDDEGYVATAQYIAKHGHLPTEDDQKYRQFAGLSLVMVPVSVVVGDMYTAGLLVIYFSAMASLALVQYYFSNFRLTLLLTFFFPWWITETVTIYGEPLVTLCVLAGLGALTRLNCWTPAKVAGLLLCGFGIVVRPPSLFFFIPFVAVLAWHFERGWGSRIAALAVASLPILVFLAWSWFTIHQLLPQARLQEELREEWMGDAVNPSLYPQGKFGMPLQALLAGVFDPSQRPGKRAMASFALLIVTCAGARLAQDAILLGNRKERYLAQGFLAGYAPYFLFHACVGGTFGFWGFERYMSQMVVPMLWGLFHRHTLRWPWMLALMVLFVFYSFLTGGTSRHPIGFLK